MPDAPVTAPSGDCPYLTDAFIRSGKRFTLLEFANGAVGSIAGRETAA